MHDQSGASPPGAPLDSCPQRYGAQHPPVHRPHAKGHDFTKARTLQRRAFPSLFASRVAGSRVAEVRGPGLA